MNVPLFSPLWMTLRFFLICNLNNTAMGNFHFQTKQGSDLLPTPGGGGFKTSSSEETGQQAMKDSDPWGMETTTAASPGTAPASCLAFPGGTRWSTMSSLNWAEGAGSPERQVNQRHEEVSAQSKPWRPSGPPESSAEYWWAPVRELLEAGT